jgi:pimeloyl-ACP methyl ester carboxylesterase
VHHGGRCALGRGSGVPLLNLFEPERRFLTAGEVALCLERFGAGPRHLLFAHGWISARRMWYDVVARLDPAIYTAHVLDFRGCGLSDRPSDGHDLYGYADDLSVALAAMDRPVTVIAHSMGGKIAQFVALDRPRALERLVLVAPGTAKAYHLSERHRAMALDAFGSRARIERFQRGAMVRELAREVMERIVEDALLAQREAWFGWYGERGRGVDFAERLAEIDLPVAVVAGDRDPLASPARLRRDVQALLRGSVFIELRGSGHNLAVETPDEIAGIIDRFITA